MKKLTFKYIFPVVVLVIGLQFGCNKAVDLKPINEVSDADFWKTADHFRLAANEFYTYLRVFSDITFETNPHSDFRSDLLTAATRVNFSNGTNTLPLTDGTWNNSFTRIRATNYLLDRATGYSTPAEIAKYVGEAKFFRAYIYFDLLQLYGGVPIIDKLLGIDSPELQAPRNTRDQVADFIIADLEAAIASLPVESAIGAAEKGRISKGAAQAFLSRVALYEGTWQKFRNNAARANALLDKAIAASDAVITSNQYDIFAPAVLGDSAQKYMFILENEKSNPANLTKAANKEYILSNRYDFTLRQIRTNITHSLLGSWVTKKFADMYLLRDGLPIDKSPLFQGYATTRSEYVNRDNRMRFNMMIDGNYYWDNEAPSSRVTWLGDAADIAHSRGKHNGAVNTGYQNQKWATERRLDDNQEGYDYPVIRLAEVLLNYAEALFERNGIISDADLTKSLNKIRLRVNKAMPSLTNAFVAANGLDMRTEIRRERTIELYLEGFRIDDLKRWKTAEIEMPKPLEGITYTGTEWQTRWPGISNSIVNGVYRLETNRTWTEKHYLLPIPTQQIQLNPQLAPNNPGW